MSACTPDRTGSDAWNTSTSLLAGLDASNDNACWRRLVQWFQPLLVRHAMNSGLSVSDAEDVAQETFSELIRTYRAGRFDRARGRLRNWLFGILRNQIRSRRRAIRLAGRDGQGRSEEVATSSVEDEGLWPAWEQQWQDALVHASLETVAQEVGAGTYEAFVLFAVKGHPAAEVGERLGMTQNAVFLAKRRVLGRMRELLSQLENEL